MTQSTPKTALVFPGQGAQYSGMGKDLYESSKAAKNVFDALEAIRPGTIKQCFEGTKEELSQTVNTQPCIFAVSMAHAAELTEDGFPSAVAGFSLGEACALTFSGALSLEDGFKAVIKRAEYMTECTANHKGAMSAVLRMETAAAEVLAKAAGVYPVNYNCPGQVVVSGEAEKMQSFNSAVNAHGGRAMPLAVSGAFHSPLMAQAAKNYRAYLDTLVFNAPKCPIYANKTAKPYAQSSQEIKDAFASQIASPVLWEQTVRNMRTDGITEFVEAEPGKVLTGLIAKIS